MILEENMHIPNIPTILFTCNMQNKELIAAYCRILTAYDTSCSTGSAAAGENWKILKF